MNILYTLNDKFVPQVATGICSVCENNKKIKNITFYLISDGITSENKSKLNELVKKYDRKLEIIELGDLSKHLDFELDSRGWNPVAVSRLLMDKFLPNDIDKILYMDGDTIVRGNLENLYNCDLGDKVVGMSIEPTADRNRISILNIGSRPYCNSGVLMINYKKWKNTNAGTRTLEFYKEHDGNLFAIDQDAINGALKNEIYYISPKYNYCNIYDQYSYSFLKKLMKNIFYISKNEFDDARNNPIIIHYLGEERPWRKGNTHKYKKDYYKYLSMTEWKDTPKEQGWILYFICWRIFNVLTKPFPAIRYNIINSLIPKFMNYRKKQLKNNSKNH